VDTEDLISHPHIWRGFEGGKGAYVTDTALPTGFAELDRYLPGGGWPLKAITEVFIDRYGIGELSLLMPALARASQSAAAQWIVWIAPPFIPYAPALTRCGVDLSRVLLVHPTSATRDALWATEQAIRSRASTAVLAWLPDADHAALRRLQLSAEEGQCWVVLFRPLSSISTSSPAALRIGLSPRAGGARIDIVKCRGRRPSIVDLEGLQCQARPAHSGKAEWP
jgi:protein ImuA